METSILSNETASIGKLTQKESRTSYSNYEKKIIDLIASENWEKLKSTLKKPAVFHKLFGSKHSLRYSSKCIYKHNILLFACRFNPPFDIVDFLVKLNPQATFEKDAKGRYALHIACKYGCDYEVIELLLKSNPGAAKEIDINYQSPYLLACKSYVKNNKWSSATKDLLKVLKEFDKIDTRMHALEDKNGVTPLEYAIEEELSMKVITYIQQIIEDRRNEAHKRNDVLSKSERVRLDIKELCMKNNYVLPREYGVGTYDSSMRSLTPINQTTGITIKPKQLKIYSGFKKNDRITNTYEAYTPILTNKII